MTNKVEKQTTTMSVYKKLYELIIEGYFQPGEWIRERQIKEIFGISSTPIREAMRMLVQERILESIPHLGVRVREITVKEIADTYELRAELEGIAAYLAAKRGSVNDFKRIEEVLAEMENSIDTTNSVLESDAIALNDKFHNQIAKASGNQVLENMLSQLSTGIRFIQGVSWKSNSERSFETFKQHRDIVEAMIVRNQDLARDKAHNHVWDSAPYNIPQNLGEQKKSSIVEHNTEKSVSTGRTTT